MKRLSSSGISALLIPIALCGVPYARSESPSSANPRLACEINPTTVGENGYQLEVYLTNTGAGTIHGWTVIMDFTEPHLITGSWNADIAETSPDTISGSNVAWNGKLLPGQTTSFGLQGNHDGSFVLPACTAR
jgi:cellulase/cellobiase CelA1